MKTATWFKNKETFFFTKIDDRE